MHDQRPAINLARLNWTARRQRRRVSLTLRYGRRREEDSASGSGRVFLTGRKPVPAFLPSSFRLLPRAASGCAGPEKSPGQDQHHRDDRQGEEQRAVEEGPHTSVAAVVGIGYFRP